MSTLDIRNKDEISDIQFDNTKDRIKFKDGYLILYSTSHKENIDLVCWDNFDDFISACHKAKELAGK